MEYINKDTLLKALENRYGDLSDNSGGYIRTDNGMEWLSVAEIVNLINEL